MFGLLTRAGLVESGCGLAEVPAVMFARPFFCGSLRRSSFSWSGAKSAKQMLIDLTSSRLDDDVLLAEPAAFTCWSPRRTVCRPIFWPTAVALGLRRCWVARMNWFQKERRKTRGRCSVLARAAGKCRRFSGCKGGMARRVFSASAPGIGPTRGG